MNKVTDGEGRNGIKGQFREADRSLHFFQSRIVCPRRFPMNRLFLPSLLSHLNNLVSLDFPLPLRRSPYLNSFGKRSIEGSGITQQAVEIRKTKEII